MFDHVKFGVSDFAASKAFFLKALEPLGVAVVAEGPPTYGVELCQQGKSKLSIARLWRRVAKTMVRLVCARTTTRTTMQPSSLVRTGTTSKWFATNLSNVRCVRSLHVEPPRLYEGSRTKFHRDLEHHIWSLSDRRIVMRLPSNAT